MSAQPVTAFLASLRWIMSCSYTAVDSVFPTGAAPYGSPSGGAQGPPTPVQRCEQAPPAQRQQEPQPLAAQDAYPSHQKPGSPNRGAKRPRQEVADAADSQNKRRLVQQQGRSREHEEKQALEQQLAQHPPAAAHAQAGGQGPVAPQPQQVQQQAGVGALHEQDVDMQVADGAQQTEVQQQVMQTLLQLAGETNQDDYEAQWDEKQAKQWMRGAQQMLQVFPQSAFLVALVQRLREELSAWGELGYVAALCCMIFAIQLFLLHPDPAMHLHAAECMQGRAG